MTLKIITYFCRINLNNIELPNLDKSKYSIRFAPFGNDMNFDLMGLIDQKYKIINIQLFYNKNIESVELYGKVSFGSNS